MIKNKYEMFFFFIKFYEFIELEGFVLDIEEGK